MFEQIYINGALMELQEGKTSSLVFQSPLFTDIENIVSNRTNSIDFPTTPSNLKAIGYAQISTVKSSYPYSKHKVVYYLDGVQIFSGYGVLMSVTQSSLKFTFTWGNVSTFKKMLGTKLRSLPEDYVTWSSTGMSTYPDNYDNLLNWGAGTGAFYGEGNKWLCSHPYQRVSRLIDLIEEKSGVAVEGKERFAKYAIPCVSKIADDIAKRTNAVRVADSDPLIVNNLQYGIIYVRSQGDSKNWKIGGNGYLNVSSVDKIGIYCPEGGLDFSTSAYASVSILKAEDEDGTNATTIFEGGVFDSEYRANNRYRLSKEMCAEIDVKDIDFIAIRLTIGSNNSNPQVAWNYTPELYVYDLNDNEVGYGGLFPLQRNMPDWTASQLLKNLMKMGGLFASCVNETTIRLVSVDDLFSNRENAFDWTGKISIDRGIPTEKVSRFGSYAQKNRCSFADDDTNAQKYEAYLYVNDNTLNEESDFMTLDFAGSDSYLPSYGAKEALLIRAYKKTIDDEYNVILDYSEVKPRIAELVTGTDGREHLSFSGIDMEKILYNYYHSYQQVIERPQTLKASIRVNAIDLAKLDLLYPVYSYELGHYYAITKMTAKSDGTADVDLLQLGDNLMSHSDIPDTINDLSVSYDSISRVALAHIPSFNEEQIANLTQDPRYKIFIIREGYARRGMLKGYQWEGMEKLSSTHTDRKKYRRWRGGKKWRIIAEEYMRTGHISGQVASCDAYNISTLVFTLGEPIILPHHSHTFERKKAAKVRPGEIVRIKNRDKNGIVELYIAMYRKENNGHWRKISNTVQVRGRSDDKTEAWEFIRSNVVFSTRG